VTAAVEESEVWRIGAEVLSEWSTSRLSAAHINGGMTSRIGSPLKSDHRQATTAAAEWATRLDATGRSLLPRQAELARRFLRFEVSKLSEAAEIHLLDFQITPYRLGPTLGEVHAQMKEAVLEHADDGDRYREMLEQYQRFLVSSLQNLREQAASGIVVSEQAIPSCLAVVDGLSNACRSALLVSPERLERMPSPLRAEFVASVETSIVELRRQFAALRRYIEVDYAPHAPRGLGLSQYTDGDRIYALLIRHHTTLEVSAEAVHRRGLELVEEIGAEMSRVRASLRIHGSAREFVKHMEVDPRFRCSTPEEVRKLFLGLARRGEAAMPRAFGSHAYATYEISRLPPEVEPGMTFGFYEPPRARLGRPGCYWYNGSALESRSTVGAASLIYHELLPGHHLHLSKEMNDAARPLVRRMPTISAFNEGWAEYAADLGFELGLYEDPYDRYGRYLMQIFTASRLVVDTGLNALGWTSERAREYLTEHTALSVIEVESEILRYATSLPGQALAYALGREQFWKARHEAEDRFARQFNLPTFHRAILDNGSLPLPDLSFGIACWMDEFTAEH